MTGKKESNLIYYGYEVKSRPWRVYDALKPFLLVTYIFALIFVTAFVLLLVQQHHTKCL